MMADSNYRIVVADDDSDIVDSVRRHLEDLGSKFKDKLEIYGASSATEVIAILSQKPVDVVFLDYHFDGGINGDEIIDQIYDPFANKFVIMMSARERHEVEGVLIKEHKSLGARFRFLRKPFDYLEMQDKYLEIEQFFDSQPYPFPLAYAREASRASSTYQGQITAMKDLIESVAKYSTILLMADVKRLRAFNEVSIRVKWNLGLTFGAWLSWLESLLQGMSSKAGLTFVPELLDVFMASKTGKNKYVEMMRKFKDEVRDIEIGHGYAKDEGWYEQIVETYSEDLQLLLRKLRFIARYILLVPEKIDFATDDSGEYDYRVRILMGAESKFKLANFRSGEKLRLNETYLRAPDGRLLSIDPFLVHAVCSKCSLGRVYILDNLTASQIVYNSYCNHRRSDLRARAVLDQKYVGLM